MSKPTVTRFPTTRPNSFFGALAVSVASGAAVAGSVICQYIFQMDPCPLCLSQRLTFLVLSILGVALLAFQRVRAAAIALWALVLALCVFGLYLSGYHASLLVSAGESCSMLVPKVLGKIQDAMPSTLAVILDGTGSCTPEKGSIEFKQTAALIGAAVLLQLSLLGVGFTSIRQYLAASK